MCPPRASRVDPLADLETLETELILADVATVDRRIEKVQGQSKGRPRDFADQFAWLDRLRDHLNRGEAAVTFAEPARHTDWLTDFHLLSGKPRLYVVNVSEDAAADRRPVGRPRAGAGAGGGRALPGPVRRV